MAARTGGELVVESLLAQGVTHAFGVPGESYLAILDALHDVEHRLRFVVCRQEGGAAYMGEAYGKLTGRPGVVLVTRGPGATNAAVGIHTAMQDSTPLVVLVGQVGTEAIDREAFQEIDYRRMFGSVVKWAAQVDRVERIPEYMAQAFRRAMAGRPGPVVLALPEDVLVARADVAVPPRVSALPIGAAVDDVASAMRLLGAARSPLCLVGGRRFGVEGTTALRAFAEATGMPVACAFRHQDLFDHRHPQYAGDVGIGINPKLAARIRAADLLLVIGERLGEMTTSGYTLLEVPVPQQRLIHVYPGAEEIGRVYQPTVGIVATPAEFLGALDPAALAQPAWREQAATAHREYEAWRTPPAAPGPVDPSALVQMLDQFLPDDAIIANGAGNYTSWLHRIYRYRQPGTQLAPYSGSMGYGVPAAVAAKLLHPERVVVSYNGDGCFLMNGQELATAVQYGAAVIFIVIDNGMYGTIRMHQERHYPGRVSGTALANPDFAALARAYGAHGETVHATADFRAAFERARQSGRPALLHVPVDPQALTPSATLDTLRAQGEAAQGGDAGAMIHALGPEGRSMLARFLARRPLLAFDIDGTLAPLVATPDAARIPDALQEALARLAAVAPVAVITGRARADAQRMLAFTPAYVLGNHGVEGLPGWDSRTQSMADVTAAYRRALAAPSASPLDAAQVLLEDKRFSLSLHYRHAPDHAAAQRMILSRLATLDPVPRVIGGKCVVNVLPPGAPTKGDALRELLVHVESHAALYAGDDDTDEHVFDLPGDQVLGVRVGANDGSRAALVVDTPAEMLPLVDLLLAGSAVAARR